MNVKKILMVVLIYALTLHQATPVHVDLAIVWEVTGADVMVSCTPSMILDNSPVTVIFGARTRSKQ